MCSDVYRVWEDAKSEKSLVITRDSNPQYAYVANYPWLFFADNEKLHILAYFYEEPETECHVAVKIWYPNGEFQLFQRQEPFPFDEEEGDTYEFEEPNWETIEISFKIGKLHGEPFEELEDPEDVGMEVLVGDKRIYLDVQMLEKGSEVLCDLRDMLSTSKIKIFNVDSEMFLEMLRVIQPPFKKISRYNFPDLFLLAFRFKMQRLLAQLDEFSRTDEFDRNWVSKLNAEKVKRLLEHDHNDFQVIDEFRIKKRTGKPLKTVTIRDPEVEAVHDESSATKKSWLSHVANWCSNRKTRIIFLLIFLLFLENLMLLLWFLCIRRGKC